MWRGFVWSRVKEEATVVDDAGFVAPAASLPMAAKVPGAIADWPAPSGAARAMHIGNRTRISSTSLGMRAEEFWLAGVKASDLGQAVVVGNRRGIGKRSRTIFSCSICRHWRNVSAL